jgi:ABC-type polysaccharide transport system permease subunit
MSNQDIFRSVWREREWPSIVYLSLVTAIEIIAEFNSARRGSEG